MSGGVGLRWASKKLRDRLARSRLLALCQLADVIHPGVDRLCSLNLKSHCIDVPMNRSCERIRKLIFLDYMPAGVLASPINKAK
jgi:hypothetical protein